MRRNLCGIVALVLGVAALMWATTPTSAQRGGHGGGGHAGGGGQAAAHVGSVHYGGGAVPPHAGPAHAAQARVAPAVRSGAVRSEHYAGSPSGGGYRNPYRDEYFRHFRPGYGSFVLGDASYYYYDTLPPDYQTVVIDGVTYYVYDGVYYQAYVYGGQTVYMVVPTQ